MLRISKEKVNVIMARKMWDISELANNYGASRARIGQIFNSNNVTPVCAGRMAKALGVDVTDIIE